MRSDTDDLLTREDGHWDAVVGGETTLPPIDPAIAETIARTHALGDVNRPKPAFVTALKEKLMAMSAASAAMAPGPAPRPVSPNGLTQPVRIPLPERGQRRSFNLPLAYAIAAAMLVAIVAALLTERFGFDSRRDSPAILAPGFAATDDTLLTFTIPAGAVPTGDTVTSALVFFTVPVGTRSTWQPYCCPGPLMEYVLAGSYTVRAEAPIQVFRGNGSIEQIPTGTEVVLEPGDTLFSRNETVVEAANTGSVPVELLGWDLIEDDGTFRGHQLVGWLSDQPDLKGVSTLSASVATVELRRVTARDGDVLQQSQNELQLIVEQEVDAYLSQSTTDGSLTVVGDSPDTDYSIYVLTLTQPGMAEGTPTAGTPVS